MEQNVKMPAALSPEAKLPKHGLIQRSVDDLDNVITRLDELIGQIRNEPTEEKVSSPLHEASLEDVLTNTADEISHKVSAMHERIDTIKSIIF